MLLGVVDSSSEIRWPRHGPDGKAQPAQVNVTGFDRVPSAFSPRPPPPQHRNHGRSAIASVHGLARYGHSMFLFLSRLCAANTPRSGVLPPPAAAPRLVAPCLALAAESVVTGGLSYVLFMLHILIMIAVLLLVSPTRSSSSSTRLSHGSCSQTGP